MVRPRSYWVIYYFDTPALGIRHQVFDRVIGQVNRGCFYFFFQFYPLTLDYWVLNFLIFYIFPFNEVILGHGLVKLTKDDLCFFPMFLYLFNFDPFF